MPTFRFTLEYDGTDFAGWQRQADGERTVQAALEDALESVTGCRVAVVGAGRTDAGVHAEGQVASARLETRLVPAVLARALNARLPADVAVVEAALAADDFDARSDARSKLYRYAIWNGPARSPLRERRAHRVPGPLDLAAMRDAARGLVGTHDFASFRASGSDVTTSVRTLFAVELTGEAGAEIAVRVEGSGFLRHMVRTLVGTLLEVGRGRRAAGSLPALLAERRREAAGPTAPACGLTLVHVGYGPESGGIPRV